MSRITQRLEEARDLLTESTWIKGSYFDEGSDGLNVNSSNAKNFCGIGACMISEYNKRGMDLMDSGLFTTLNQYEDILGKAAADLYNHRAIKGPNGGERLLGHFPWFNDHEDTTLEDVLRVFNHAIKIEKEKEDGSQEAT